MEFRRRSSSHTQNRDLPWWEKSRLQAATALIAGCGALGNEVAKNLTLLGWGHILLVDFDRIESGNLDRSVFFRQSDVGRPKAVVLAERAADMKTGSTLLGLHGDIRLTLSAGLVRRMDVVFGCVDNVAARLALSKLAGLAGRPLIDGGMTAWEGTVSLFGGGREACYACGLTSQDYRDLVLRRSCPAYARLAEASAGVATTAPVSSIISAQMVQMALKWVHGLRSAPYLELGTQVRFDTAFDRYWKIRLSRNASCLNHPEARCPERGSQFDWRRSWDELLGAWRNIEGQESAVFHLPWFVLESRTCSSCGIDQEASALCLPEIEIICRRCQRSLSSQLTNQIHGGEAFSVLSPQQMKLPPWTWLLATNGSEEKLLELHGCPDEYSPWNTELQGH